MRPRTAPAEQRQPLTRVQPNVGGAPTGSTEHTQLHRSGLHCTRPSSRVWLTLAALFLGYTVAKWTVKFFFPAGLIESPQFCLQPLPPSSSLPQLSDPSSAASLDETALSHARLAYGCIGNITAVLSSRVLSSCDGSSGGVEAADGGGVLHSAMAELTQLFDSVIMNGSYRVMNVALESYDGGYLLAARLWDGWLWEDATVDRVRIAQYVYVEEHRAEIIPPLPDAPLPPHNVSSLLALVRVGYRFEPLSEVTLVADEPEVQDPRLYWLHSDGGGGSQLFVLGNTGYSRFGSSGLGIKPRRVMMRSVVTAPALVGPVSLPWQSMLSEVAWSDQKNWTPLALHFRRHVFLVSFFPLQVVDCPDDANCFPKQCDRSTAPLRKRFEVADWRGGSPIVHIPPHYLSYASNGSSESSSSSLYLTVIHQRAPAPLIYHYSHRLVALSIGHHGPQHVAVRYVSHPFQLPLAAGSEPIRGPVALCGIYHWAGTGAQSRVALQRSAVAHVRSTR